MAGQLKFMDSALSFYYHHSICGILMSGQHRRHVILIKLLIVAGINYPQDGEFKRKCTFEVFLVPLYGVQRIITLVVHIPMRTQ